MINSDTLDLNLPERIKQCGICKDFKSIDKFYSRKTKSETFDYRCKKCVSKISFEYNKKHKTREKPSRRYSQMKSRSKRLGIKCSLSYEQYCELIKPDCFYCGGLIGQIRAGVGLDRIDSLKGYEFGNVISCCQICNMVKGHKFSLEETKAMIDVVIRMRLKKMDKK